MWQTSGQTNLSKHCSVVQKQKYWALNVEGTAVGAVEEQYILGAIVEGCHGCEQTEV